MKITRCIGAIVLLFLLLTAATWAEDTPKRKPCKDHSAISGACFKVRGRLAFYNGAPGLRIWPVGTNRILGISQGSSYLEEYADALEEVVGQLSWDNVMFADFTVCPFADDKPGVIRPVCIQSAEKIAIRKREVISYGELAKYSISLA